MASKINELLDQQMEILFSGQDAESKNRVYFEIGAKWAINTVRTFCEVQMADSEQSDGENVDMISNFIL